MDLLYSFTVFIVSAAEGAYVSINSLWWTVFWIAGLVIIALIIAKLIELEPMIRGSGIPHVKGAVTGQITMNWFRVLCLKFAGGILAIGAGMSLGREGPSVQLGAVIGQGLNRLFRGLRVEEKVLITSGAGAGLAAAFNAPLAGVVFSLEELHKNFSPPVLLSATAASATADYISRSIFGIKPIFDFSSLQVLPMKYYLWLLLLGAIIGILGAFYNWSLLKSLRIYEQQNLIPKKLIMIIPLLLTVPVGFSNPDVLGGGNELVIGIHNGQYVLITLIALLGIKFALTVASYGSGAPGGIFMPLLVIGALAGGVFGHVLVPALNIDPVYSNNFAVFAMASFFTAIVKAPITGCILITEMTGSFSHLPALIIVAMMSYIVADLLKSRPIYEDLLNRILARGKKELLEEYQDSNTVLELVVCVGSALDEKQVKDIKWPKHCLLINIKRGETEIVPDEGIKIIAGDYLNFITSERRAPKTKETLLKMSGY